GRDERQAEVVHLAKELAVELQAELLAAGAEQRAVDDQGSAEVPDDDPERPLFHPDYEKQGQADRDEDVGEARADERDRALLHAEERGPLLVVDGAPEGAARRADEIRGACRAEEQRDDRAREDEQQ